MSLWSSSCPETPVVVDGDPEQIHQILVNLLLNGIEAMPEGGSLTVAIQAGDSDGGVCRVVVSDSGSGIPQPILKQIFEPFVTSKEHGVGLGLAVSHRIAKEHGGTLLANNRTEGGAMFTLELPTSAPCAHAPKTVRHPKNCLPRHQHRMGLPMAKLLVIDDEPSIRFSIEQVFAEDGVEILGAETAAEGLQLAADAAPDVILLDIRLGDRSGLDVVHDLRQLDPRSLIVFITGHGTTDTAIEAMKLGAYDYLVKPLDAGQLQQVVRQALDHKPPDAHAA